MVSNRKGVIQYDFGKQKGKVFEERLRQGRLAPDCLRQSRSLSKIGCPACGRGTLTSKTASSRSLVIPNADTDVILDDNGKRIEHPPPTGASPRVILGPIASANVVQGDFRKRDQLRDDYKVKAVEMEGYGIADATWEFERAGYLVVRGICDYCDVRTKHLQTDAWKRHAAMVAAGYVYALIEAMPGVDHGAIRGTP